MNPSMDQQNAPAANAALPHVREVLRAAEQELAGLLRQRSDLMKRIGTIKKMLSGLANLFGESVLGDGLRIPLDRKTPERGTGFTRACRLILMQSQTPLQARQCCAELRRRFPELADRHKDLGASVTSVLHRLAAYGEARSYVDENRTRLWAWIAEAGTGDDECRFVGPAGADRGATSSGAASHGTTIQPQSPQPS